MPLFLRIKNPGECPIEAFSIFGASLSREFGESSKSWVIGMFGSGAKHAIALCLRYIDEAGNHAPFSPTIFCGEHKLTFFLTDRTIKDTVSQKNVKMINIQHGGRDQKTGKLTRKKEETNHAIDYGTQDWREIHLALREFVSNALDMSFRMECSNYQDTPVTRACSMRTLSETIDPVPAWKKVVVDIVDDSKVRAEKGFTGVFVPLSPLVDNFCKDIGKWFLQFSSIKTITNTQVMEKTSRNLHRISRDSNSFNITITEPGRNAVIYRKGVRVREYNEDEDDASMFDYNINDLRMDEARQVDDYAVKNAVSRVLIESEPSVITYFFECLRECQPVPAIKIKVRELADDAGNITTEEYQEAYMTSFLRKYWEFSVIENFGYHIAPSDQARQNWQAAFDQVLGVTAVVCTDMLAGTVAAKGYLPVVCSASMEEALGRLDIRTAKKILTADDLAGRIVIDALPAAQWELDYLWHELHEVNMNRFGSNLQIDDTMHPPALKGFMVDANMPFEIQQKAWRVKAYYVASYGDNGTIFVHNDSFNGNDNNADKDSLAMHSLRITLLQQLASHITTLPQQDQSYWVWFVHLSASLIERARGSTRFTAK